MSDTDETVTDPPDALPAADAEDTSRGTGEDDHLAQKLADAEARADTYARALFEARTAALGRLADPSDLPYSAELVDDADALSAAVTELLERKPHLASRRPAWGDVGAGQTRTGAAGPSWADLFGAS